MDELKFPYVLVAERSVLPVIRLALQGIQAYGNPKSTSVVVPSSQIGEFRAVSESGALVIPEDEVLPEWSLARVRAEMPRHPQMAGWYLQQFLKLSFGSYAGVPRYVIWDADTVMLSPINFTEGGVTLMNTAREHHQEYFETFAKLFGRQAPLRRSLISQYMLIETQVVDEMRREIEGRFSKDWIAAILSLLPGKSLCEFSEYETYGNFFAVSRPERLKLRRMKWFRRGAEVIRDLALGDFDTIREKFAGYAYVAFERHHEVSFLRRIRGRGSLLLRLSS
jgi:hypothetical protein